MKPRDFDPLRLDVAAFAEAGGRLEGDGADRWLRDADGDTGGEEEVIAGADV